MIVSCAPFRVSFAGGGSDLPSFYRKHRGAVLSCTIAKHSFIIVHPFFNATKYHLKYARTELVDTLDEIQHPILREALRMHEIGPGIEIVSVADVPAGTGLGSSSSFSVALINALYAYRRMFVPKETLAHEACVLEIERLGEPIGKQDQYAAAYGGINFIEFQENGGTIVQPVVLPPATAAALESRLLLFFTGIERDARAVLAHQVAATDSEPATVAAVGRMVQLAHEMRDLLLAGDLDAFGDALDRGWEMKRALTPYISSGMIDEIYARARAAGALGGKLVGAGGGGFLLLYCPVAAHPRVRAALAALQGLDFQLDWSGAHIAFAQ